jgi:hypothetical protein
MLILAFGALGVMQAVDHHQRQREGGLAIERTNAWLSNFGVEMACDTPSGPRQARR